MSKLPKNYTYRPLPKELFIGFSDIEGNGLFAGEEIAKDQPRPHWLICFCTCLRARGKNLGDIGL